ncbi:hypothetical protein GCM10022254_39600 [Actinomadura meridiana]|uniref:Uncharacterized protein n=1 Tax=Actinomadura meridiana TaxID=559626 RepID=A0ABP8C6N7_9ACTN
MDQTSGALAYINMSFSMADEASAFAAQQHDLVCYDPQTERLRP